jgi:hypothetical protein
MSQVHQTDRTSPSASIIDPSCDTPINTEALKVPRGEGLDPEEQLSTGEVNAFDCDQVLAALEEFFSALHLADRTTATIRALSTHSTSH